MKTIDIIDILSTDLKSRARVRDFELFIQNCGKKTVMLDFSNVQFATRSFVDEFYNVFLKTPKTNSVKVEITNAPEDVNTILEAVSRAPMRTKIIPSRISVKSFHSVDDLVHYLKAA